MEVSIARRTFGPALISSFGSSYNHQLDHRCWMYEGSPYHQASISITNFWLGPFLTTGHFLKDGGFSSIPPTYDQHTKPFA
jgi:hypothetical protein